jgi:hypothetical protein
MRATVKLEFGKVTVSLVPTTEEERDIFHRIPSGQPMSACRVGEGGLVIVTVVEICPKCQGVKGQKCKECRGKGFLVGKIDDYA